MTLAEDPGGTPTILYAVLSSAIALRVVAHEAMGDLVRTPDDEDHAPLARVRMQPIDYAGVVECYFEERPDKIGEAEDLPGVLTENAKAL